MSKQLKKDEFKIVDDMKPLKDYLQGKSTTIEFVETCREIRTTEDAEFEIIEPKQINHPKED